MIIYLIIFLFTNTKVREVALQKKEKKVNYFFVQYSIVTSPNKPEGIASHFEALKGLY